MLSWTARQRATYRKERARLRSRRQSRGVLWGQETKAPDVVRSKLIIVMCRSTREDIPRQGPDPDTGDEKEVYAFYGLASYTAQVAERELIQLALLLRLRRIQGATQATYDREYEAIAQQTFGQILKELSEDQVLEDDLRSLLRRALRERNRLTHRFFWEFAEEFLSQEGRLRMIRTLQDATAILSAAGDSVGRVVNGMGNEMGVDRQVVDEMCHKLLWQAQHKYDGG